MNTNRKNLKNHYHGDYNPDWKIDLLVEDKLVNKKRLKKWKYFDKM